MSDVKRLVEAIGRRFPAPQPSVDPVWSMAPAAKVIDCVLSLNRHYDRFVFPRVQRFTDRRPDITSLASLKNLIASYVEPLEFSRSELQYDDRRRSEVLTGVIHYLLEAQQEFPAATETERLNRWATWARPGDYLSVGVRGFGLAGFQYLRMLFGADTTKPDVHIVRFVSDTLGRKVTDVQALYILESASRQANLRLRDLDTSIWEAAARHVAAEA